MTNPTLDVLTADGGHFRVYVTPPGGKLKDITWFRGAPTQIGSLSMADPFGPATGQLTFPSVTAFDRPGQGDLNWLVPWADVDIYYANENGAFDDDWRWEGQIVSEEISSESISVQLRGALFQADNYKAAPWYPTRPVPYELLIADALDPTTHPALHTKRLITKFPKDWATKVPEFKDPDYLWFLKPWGVKAGANWTGLTTRNTGSWDSNLTGQVKSLLAVMYTPEGDQWTIGMKPGRSPSLFVRRLLTYPVSTTLHLWLGVPGVEASFSRDFTQTTNVIFGTGKDLDGTSYSNQQVTTDGQRTYYEPFAASKHVYPNVKSNKDLLPSFARLESRMTFPDGLDPVVAADVAAAHMRRFSDPGYTGTINLQTDPLKGGQPFSRMLIKPGDTVLLHNLRGTDVLFHISEVTINPMEGTASITVDSKFRDLITISEVRARTRDALDPVRLLKIGALSITSQDQILPWSYKHGSGVIPSGGTQDATDLFINKMKENKTTEFPWTEFTKKYPPKKYAKYYIKIDKTNAVASKNWSGLDRDGISVAGIPIRMSQDGTIRLIQIAAYDENGNVLPVRFHFSIYSNSGITVKSMPMIPTKYNLKYGPKSNTTAQKYKKSERYPFYPGAFEEINPDGTKVSNPGQMYPGGAGLLIGWGNYYEPAGYWPKGYSKRGKKTGMLVDEPSWSYSTTGIGGFDPQSVDRTRKNPTAGLLYGMIFCDDQGTKPVYFLGRMFVASPGSGGGS